MKKVIVISTSLRAGSNSQVLAEQFAEGGKTFNHEPATFWRIFFLTTLILSIVGLKYVG